MGHLVLLAVPIKMPLENLHHVVFLTTIREHQKQKNKIFCNIKTIHPTGVMVW